MENRHNNGKNQHTIKLESVFIGEGKQVDMNCKKIVEVLQFFKSISKENAEEI